MANKQVRITMVIPLRDFAAFEDLAAELGCEIEVLDLKNQASPPDKKGRHRVSRGMIEKTRRYWDSHPEATAAQVKEALGLPHGVSTLARIRRGDIQ